MAYFTLYSKENCPPCQKILEFILPKLKNDNYLNVVKFQTTEETQEAFKKYNVSHVPFLVINNKQVFEYVEIHRLFSCLGNN